MPWFEEVVLNSQMIIGNGSSIVFWCNNWTGQGPLILGMHNSTTFSKFKGCFFIMGLELSDQVVAEISSLEIMFFDKQDLLMWTASSTGKFLVKSAWSIIRQCEQHNELVALIWEQRITPSAQLIGWKILSCALPVDSKFVSIGVAMASSCSLCML